MEGLRKWERDGVLVPERTPTNHWRYRMRDLQTLMHERTTMTNETTCVIYARVSTKKQEDAGNLERQIGRLTSYAMREGWRIVAVITDTASGMNEHRNGIQRVLHMIATAQATKVVVEYKDRLARIYGKRGGEKLVEAVQTALHEDGESP